MALLTVTTISRLGVDVTGVAADAAGDTFPVADAFVEIKNGSAASINATLDIKSTVDGAAVTDPVVAIAAGATKAIGPFPRSIYGDANGLGKVTCSAVASVTIKALKFVAST